MSLRSRHRFRAAARTLAAIFPGMTGFLSLAERSAHPDRHIA
jgi:hypothetical protein